MTVARKSCFVVAPYEVPLNRFLEALRRENVEPFFISDFLKSGILAISNIRAAFKSVDLVIALLIAGRPLDNVIFEIGLAAGLGRPLLIFADRETEIPSDLSGLPITRTDLSNLEDTISSITHFLNPPERVENDFEQPARLRSFSGERTRRRLYGHELRNRLQEVRNQWAQGRDIAQSEKTLVRLLTDLGWTLAEAPPTARAYTPDLAVWIDDVQKEIGNPLAVEIKGPLREVDLNRVVEQLTNYLRGSSAKAGVVLYAGPELQLRANVAQGSPPIFAFSVDEFSDLIERDKFAATLKASAATARRTA